MAAFLPGISFGQPADGKPELAKRYVDLRSGLFMSDWQTAPQPELDVSQMDEMATEIVRSLKQSPSWNPAHPAWARVQAAVRRDLDSLVASVKADSRIKALNIQIMAAIVRGLANEFSAAELNALIEFYNSPRGRRFNEVQRKMLQLVSDALADQFMRPGNPPPGAAGIDPGRFASVFGPVDDGIRWMAHAMGDQIIKGGDAYQMLLEGVSPVVRLKFRELETVLLELTEAERRAVFDFRDSSLGRQERAALLNAGKELGAVFNAGSELERLLGMLQAKEKDWRALVPN